MPCMIVITNEKEWFAAQAQNVYSEIIADIDKHEYWHPKIVDEHWPKNVPKHNTFEQAYMKFLNGNLNYYHFPNMVAHSQEQDGWNPVFPKTIDFCNSVRRITGNKGPFGRMCVWNLPPGRRLLPHVDNFEYHRHIIRNIFIVSPDLPGTKIRISGQYAPVSQGSFFQFRPDTEKHEFINNSDQHFYFLGFDYWIMDKLNAALTLIDVNGVIADPERMKPIDNTWVYGSMNTKCKYQSPH